MMMRPTHGDLPDSGNAPSAPARQPADVRRLRLRVALIGLVLVAGIGAALLLGRDELMGLMDDCVVALRRAGPVAFFLGMAVLPAIGFPLLPFVLAAGPVFGPVMGVGPVVACAIAAVALNVTLSYLLASRTLRPLVLRLMDRLGYRLPAVPGHSVWQVVWLVRLAPGLPFWTQSYLLGLARVPFLPYLVVSTLLPAAYISGTIIFGKALFEGRMKHALIALAAVGLVAVTVQLLRRRRSGREPSAAT